jgi:hypothetical protein
MKAVRQFEPDSAGSALHRCNRSSPGAVRWAMLWALARRLIFEDAISRHFSVERRN